MIVRGHVFQGKGSRRKGCRARLVCLRRRKPAKTTWGVRRDKSRWVGNQITQSHVEVGSFSKCAEKSSRDFKQGE